MKCLLRRRVCPGGTIFRRADRRPGVLACDIGF
jgi:hypothetical protein